MKLRHGVMFGTHRPASAHVGTRCTVNDHEWQTFLSPPHSPAQAADLPNSEKRRRVLSNSTVLCKSTAVEASNIDDKSSYPSRFYHRPKPTKNFSQNGSVRLAFMLGYERRLWRISRGVKMRLGVRLRLVEEGYEGRENACGWTDGAYVSRASS